MSLEFLMQMYIPLAVAGSIVVGFVMKKWLPTDNKWIPTVLPLVGIIIACLIDKSFEVSTIVAGAVSGLAGVGLHQAVTQHIDSGDTYFTEDTLEELSHGIEDGEDIE